METVWRLERNVKTKLTKRSVEAVRPGEKDIWLYDSELKGFGLKVTPKGSRVYFVQYWFAGRRRRYTIGHHGSLTTHKARLEAQRILGEVASGEDPAAIKSASKIEISISELADRYMIEYAEVHKKPLSIAADERSLRLVILPNLGHLSVSAITRQDISKVHHAFRDEPVKANRALALLSKMFNLAEEWGLRPDGSNPCRHVKKYTEKKRERFLSTDELTRLGQALSKVEQEGTELTGVTTAIRLLILTGARLSEILTLKWDYIKPDLGAIALPDSKTGRKMIPLSRPAIEVLKAAKRVDGNPYVCPGAKEGGHIVGVQRPWQRIRKKAGIEDVRIHDLRHSFASVGAASGLGLPIIGALLGHTQAATTQRYAHLSNDPMKAAADEIGRKISEAMNGSSKSEH